MAKTVIPYTPMMSRYHELKELSRKERLKAAEKLSKRPGPLVRDFRASVEAFALGYSNAYEPFVPVGGRGDLPKIVPNEITDTNQLVARMGRGTLKVDGPNDLSVRVVEREVSVIRTKNAIYGSPKVETLAAGRGLLADFIGVTADKTPIVGEIKVTRGAKKYVDKDPYSALVQALAAAAHLVTPSQYDRLCHCWPRRFNRELRQVDVMVVTAAYDPELTLMEELLHAALDLSETLRADTEIARFVRQINLIDARPTGASIVLKEHFVPLARA